MSVTFSSTAAAVEGWTLDGWCHTYRNAPRSAFPDKSAAESAAAQHESHCEPCRDGGTAVWPEWDIAPVNLANGNAGTVLHLLGYPTEELVGSTTAEDLLQRCRRELNWVGIEGHVDTVRRVKDLHLLASRALEAGGGRIEWG